MRENAGKVQQLIVCGITLLRVENHPAFRDRPGRFIGKLRTCDAEHTGRRPEEIFQHLTLRLRRCACIYSVVYDMKATAIVSADHLGHGRGVTNVRQSDRREIADDLCSER
jgi:hypothetical protein